MNYTDLVFSIFIMFNILFGSEKRLLHYTSDVIKQRIHAHDMCEMFKHCLNYSGH